MGLIESSIDHYRPVNPTEISRTVAESYGVPPERIQPAIESLNPRVTSFVNALAAKEALDVKIMIQREATLPQQPPETTLDPQG